jgi:hypothetical protein
MYTKYLISTRVLNLVEVYTAVYTAVGIFRSGGILTEYHAVLTWVLGNHVTRL